MRDVGSHSLPPFSFSSHFLLRSSLLSSPPCFQTAFLFPASYFFISSLLAALFFPPFPSFYPLPLFPLSDSPHLSPSALTTCWPPLSFFSISSLFSLFPFPLSPPPFLYLFPLHIFFSPLLFFFPSFSLPPLFSSSHLPPMQFP